MTINHVNVARLLTHLLTYSPNNAAHCAHGPMDPTQAAPSAAAFPEMSHYKT